MDRLLRRIGRTLLLAALIGWGVMQVTGAAATGGGPAWATYHHDGTRTGVDPDSTSPVTPAQVWASPKLDGAVYAEPLLYGSTVYVATENDTVYALDAASGQIVWQRHLAAAVPGSDLPCGDISTVGITSTPVIDPASGEIYVVDAEWDGSSTSSIHHAMYGLSLSTGAVGVGPVGVDPAGSTPAAQLQRAGLALDAGKVIIGFGGNYGDCGSYHGWLVAVPESGGSQQTFEVDSSTNGGAIWGSGNAPAIDSNGDLWISTANGRSSSFGYQESVIRLDSNMALQDYWAPANWSSLDSSDTDLGSTMPLLLPGGLVFEIGKAGEGYLLSASNLGHEGGPPAYSAGVCSGSWGGGIYTNGISYVACSDGLHALSLDTANRRFSALSGWSIPSSAVGPPILAGGLVWSAGWHSGTLYGLDPSNGTVRFAANLGSFEHFATPSAAGGRLFVANGTHVTAFQIATYVASTTSTTTTGNTTTTATSTTSTSSPSARAGAPSLSHIRARPTRRGIRLTFMSSRAAVVTVRLGSRRFTLHARAGANRFGLRRHRLRPGAHRLTIRARSADGRLSPVYRITVVVRG